MLGLIGCYGARFIVSMYENERGVTSTPVCFFTYQYIELGEWLTWSRTMVWYMRVTVALSRPGSCAPWRMLPSVSVTRYTGHFGLWRQSRMGEGLQRR